MTTLDEIQARADASTEGPWEAYRDGLTMYVRDKEGYLDPIQTGYVGNRGTVTDAEFIAHAREDVPKLVAALRAAEAAASKWESEYADKTLHWDQMEGVDAGCLIGLNQGAEELRAAIREALG